MNTFIKFNRGLLAMPLPWRLWLLLLLTLNLIAPLVFIGRLEAQATVAALLVSMALMTGLTGLSGFSRLLGLGHIVWVPLLVFLWTRLGEIPAADALGPWVPAVLALNATPVAIDAAAAIRDAARPELLVKEHGHGEGAHARPAHGAIGHVDAVRPGEPELGGAPERPARVQAPRRVDLDADDETTGGELLTQRRLFQRCLELLGRHPDLGRLGGGGHTGCG